MFAPKNAKPASQPLQISATMNSQPDSKALSGLKERIVAANEALYSRPKWTNHDDIHSNADGQAENQGKKPDGLARDFSQIPNFASYPIGRGPMPHSLGPLSAPLPIQAKLAVGSVNDPLEDEADRVAERVMRMPSPLSGDASHTPPAKSPSDVATLQRKCACGGSCDDCKKKKSGQEQRPLQRKQASGNAPALTEAPPIVHEVLNSPGQPLDTATRAFIEPRFGQDFSHVRVHSEPRAQQSASEIFARAYTGGNHIVFASGGYSPSSEDGMTLLAHELTHVVQQSRSGTTIQRWWNKVTSDANHPADTPPPAKESMEQHAGEDRIIQLTSQRAPAGIGLRVPVASNAVHGVHEWGDKDKVPGVATLTQNTFKIRGFRITQLVTIDERHNAGVYVYRATASDSGGLLAIGPDYIFGFFLSLGGEIAVPGANSDQLNIPQNLTPGMETRTLPPAPDAFDEEPQIVYMAPQLPRPDNPEIDPMPFLVDAYWMTPHLRKLPTGQWAVLYYIAHRNAGNGQREEWVVGPRSLRFFVANVDFYLGTAGLAFLTPGGGPPPEYVQRSTRFVMGVMHNDPERAREGVKGWKAAGKDPFWWIQVFMGYASAAQPRPPVAAPNLRILQGGSTETVPTPGAAASGVTVLTQPSTAAQAAPGGAQGFAGNAALKADPVVASDPVPLTPPLPAAATRPQGVPGRNPNPVAVMPRINPLPAVVVQAVVDSVGQMDWQRQPTNVVNPRQAIPTAHQQSPSPLSGVETAAAKGGASSVPGAYRRPKPLPQSTPAPTAAPTTPAWQLEPKMPEGLSPKKKAKRKECLKFYQIYKKGETATKIVLVGREIQAIGVNYGTMILNVRKSLCAKIHQQIELVERHINDRRRYIDDGCDEFDWFERGSTEAERRLAHEGQVDNMKAQEANLRELLHELQNQGVC